MADKMKEESRNRGTAAGMATPWKPGEVESRFARMFNLPAAKELPEPCLLDIACAMIKKDAGKPITESETVDENPAIPAGYTYFGQFIDTRHHLRSQAARRRRDR